LRADEQGVAGASKSYLTFRVAGKDLAVEAAHVRGILPLSELVRMPCERPGFLGIVNLSGRVANVIDLAARLHLPASRPGSQPKIVVLEVAAGDPSHGDHSHMTGFVADRVSGVVTYRARALHNGILRGIGRPRTLIDFAQLVTGDDMAGMWAFSP
jgi:chemotaxis signal transduction protein